MWFIYPILVPFYFMGKNLTTGAQKFASGVPQVADYYLLGVMVLVFTKLPFRVSRPLLPVVWALASFVLYTAFINGAWAAYLENLSLLQSTVFYLYDFLLFLTCLILYGAFKEQFIKATLWAVAASVGLQLVLSPFAFQHEFARQALFFNDENQLGYYCLLAATIFVVGARHFSVPAPYQFVFYVAIGYLALLAQCRAALMALGALFILFVLARPLRLMLMLGSVAAIYLVITLEPSLVGKTEERFVVSGEYDTLETRGYDRILNHPEHLLLGAGEGAYERFRSALFGSEIHSSYGTLLFCYGLIGTALFSAALVYLGKSDPRTILFLIPAFVYGSAHHGLRFSSFWTLLGFLSCVALERALGRGHDPIASTNHLHSSHGWEGAL